MAKPKYLPLDPQQLRELATLVSAGVSTAQAWEKSSAKNHLAGNSILSLLTRGKTLSTALFQFSLVSPSQRIVILAAENSGELPATLGQLADECESRAAYKKQLGSKLRSSTLLLLIGWATGLIANGAADPDSLGALFVVNTAKCLFGYWVIRQVIKIGLQDAWWWFRLVWKYGQFGNQSYQYAFTVHWLGLLGTLLRAGVDVSTALTSMKGLIPVSSYSSAITNAAHETQNGETLSLALSQNSLLTTPTLEQVISTAEASGRIGDELKHQVQLAQQLLEINIAQLLFWIPKLAYAFCAVLASSMILF
jgi:type II secretory pathway component PulF